jgi:hypothetical protein
MDDNERINDINGESMTTREMSGWALKDSCVRLECALVGEPERRRIVVSFDARRVGTSYTRCPDTASDCTQSRDDGHYKLVRGVDALRSTDKDQERRIVGDIDSRQVGTSRHCRGPDAALDSYGP